MFGLKDNRNNKMLRFTPRISLAGVFPGGPGTKHILEQKYKYLVLILPTTYKSNETFVIGAVEVLKLRLQDAIDFTSILTCGGQLWGRIVSSVKPTGRTAQPLFFFTQTMAQCQNGHSTTTVQLKTGFTIKKPICNNFHMTVSL